MEIGQTLTVEGFAIGYLFVNMVFLWFMESL